MPHSQTQFQALVNVIQVLRLLRSNHGSLRDRAQAGAGLPGRGVGWLRYRRYGQYNWPFHIFVSSAFLLGGACRDESVGAVVGICVHSGCITVRFAMLESSVYATCESLSSSNMSVMGHQITLRGHTGRAVNPEYAV